MSGEGTSAGPSGSGRGRGQTTKGKFAPTVPGRRKKEGAAEGSLAAAEEAKRDDDFRDLIRAADSEGKWQGGRGRGRRTFQPHEQRHVVAFGGGVEQRGGSAPAKSKSAKGEGEGKEGGKQEKGSSSGKGGGSSGGKESGSAKEGKAGASKGGGKGGRAGSAKGVKPDTTKLDRAAMAEGDGAAAMDVDDEDEKDEGLLEWGAKHKGQVQHDYLQYYPTTLPFQPPPFLADAYPPEEGEEDECEGGREQAGLVNTADLAMTQDRAGNAAKQLHLLDAEDPDFLFLVQLPSILPIHAPQPANKGGGKAGTANKGGVAGSSGSGKQQQQQQQQGPSAVGGIEQIKTEPQPSEAGTSGRVQSGVGGQQGGGQQDQQGVSGAGASHREEGAPVPEGSSARNLPPGQIGKLLVFKSGRVKLQMGDVLMDVSAGMPTAHRQDATTVNCNTKDCVFMGGVTQRMVISPDIYQLMEDSPVPSYPHEDWTPRQEQLRAAAAKARHEKEQVPKGSSRERSKAGRPQVKQEEGHATVKPAAGGASTSGANPAAPKPLSRLKRLVADPAVGETPQGQAGTVAGPSSTQGDGVQAAEREGAAAGRAEQHAFEDEEMLEDQEDELVAGGHLGRLDSDEAIGDDYD